MVHCITVQMIHYTAIWVNTNWRLYAPLKRNKRIEAPRFTRTCTPCIFGAHTAVHRHRWTGISQFLHHGSAALKNRFLCYLHRGALASLNRNILLYTRRFPWTVEPVSFTFYTVVQVHRWTRIFMIHTAVPVHRWTNFSFTWTSFHLHPWTGFWTFGSADRRPAI